MTELTVLVLGGGDVGSAVAHCLFAAGAKVALCDRPRSAHSRRGMAYTDALFEGSAILEGVIARHVLDVSAIQDAWKLGEVIPLAALPDTDLIEALSWDALVDATMQRHAVAADRRLRAGTVIGLGPGYTPGLNCHIAIETQWGSKMGAVLRHRSTEPTKGGPEALDGVGRERFVSAAASGVWRTSAAIGQRVHAGDVVGSVDATPVLSPLTGTLRGLTHDGAAVRVGQKVVEVDPRDPPQIFGLGVRPRAIAQGVCRALALE